MEILLALVFMTVSGYWLQQGLAVYGFYVDGKPGSGFMGRRKFQPANLFNVRIFRPLCNADTR